VAVDVAGVLRAQLARAHRQHGPVQQGHALGHTALLDQGAALEQVAGGGQVGVGVATAQLPQPAGRVDHRAGVLAAEGALQLQVEQVAVLDPLRLVGEQPLGPADPAGPDHPSPRRKALTPIPMAAMAAGPGRPSSR
jgi:adhesin HecA-like repeat protein